MMNKLEGIENDAPIFGIIASSKSRSTIVGLYTATLPRSDSLSDSPLMTLALYICDRLLGPFSVGSLRLSSGCGERLGMWALLIMQRAN